MSIDRLIGLRARVDGALSAKVIHQRRALQSELSNLARFQGAGARSKSALGLGARGKVAAKYRNPDDHSQTWAGRGSRPRWLTAAIKAGKSPDDFLIVGAVTSAKANGSKAQGRKKVRKARK
jgi:DNA-binding protein H-NS